MGIMLKTLARQEYDNNKNMELTKDNHAKMSVEIPRMFFPILLLMLRRSGSYAVVVRYIVLLLCMLCKKLLYWNINMGILYIYTFIVNLFLKSLGPWTQARTSFFCCILTKIKQVLFSLNSKYEIHRWNYVGRCRL